MDPILDSPPHLLLLLGALVAAALAWAVHRRASLYRLLAGIAFASEGLLPLVGHLPAILLNFHQGPAFFARIAQRAPSPTVRIHIPFLPAIIFTSDPLAIEQVLTKLDTFAKGHFFQSRSRDLFGNGIINSDGAMWKIQRKAGASFFSPRNIKRWVEEVFPLHMTRLHAVLARAAAANVVVNVQELVLEFTLRVFLDIAYGITVGPDEELPADVRAFGDAFDAATAGIEYRFFAPWWKVEEMVTTRGSEMAKNVKIVKDFGNNIVAMRRKAMAQEAGGAAGADDYDHQDLLSLFIECARRTEESEEPVTDDVLSDWILNFLSAARDTTAQAITWALYKVFGDAKVASALRTELLNRLPPPPSLDTSPTPVVSYDDFKPKNLPYTHAVVHETLRLYPSVPMELKEAQQEDIEFPRAPGNDGDVSSGKARSTTTVPAGSIIIWSPYAMGRSTRLWGSEAARFDPDRWLEADDDDDSQCSETQEPKAMRMRKSPPSPYVFTAFNAGPRTCLGKNLAVVEVACVLAAVIRRWDLEIVSGGEIGNGLTLPMRKGLMCR
ncbi:hypothetical protein HDU89_007151, partial [Geranomyces variabilis]